MAALPWISYLQRMVGRGHPTLSDTLNTPLRTVLSQSGYDPDATTFPGLMGPINNVLAFGAVGDGVQDDVPGWLAAVNALPTGGGTVYCPRPPTNYRMGQDFLISRPNVSMQFDAGTTLMGGFSVRADADNVHLAGVRHWGNIGLANGPAGTYFDYQSAGTGVAFQLGSVVAARSQISLSDIAIAVSGSGTNAIAVSLNRLVMWQLNRPRISGGAGTNHTGIKVDGGTSYCGGGLIDHPYISNAPNAMVFTGTGGASVVTSSTIRGGFLAGPGAAGTGLLLTLSDGCFLWGTNIEGYATGIDFNGCSNCIMVPRLESNTQDLNWHAGSINNIVMVARRDVTFNNTGLTNRLITGTRATNGTFNLTDAATIAVNAAEGNVFLVTLGGNRTMAAPTNPFMGQRITFLVGQDGTGGRTLAWNAAYRTNWSDTGNTLNKRCSISFVFDGGSDWMQDGAQSAYI